LYFEQKDIFNAALESQKKRVQELQLKVTQAKAQYSRSLRNLEDISESIHERRKLRHLWCPFYESPFRPKQYNNGQFFI
jgi:hypothetical protein